MNNPGQLALFIILTFFLLSTQTVLWGQPCSGDSPITYAVVDDSNNPGQCFLKINWGSAMPKIECGSPGSPASGSTIPANRKIMNLSVIINGTTYILYNKSGGNCTGATVNLVYGPDANSYITAVSNADFCHGENISGFHIDGNQTGSTVINCDLQNANPPIPSPVSLEAFSGTSANQNNYLSWKTVTEENTDFFEIQRSGDGQAFSTLAEVTAVGFSSTTQTYSWEDRQPLRIAYYRLRIVDFDGSESLSPVIVIERPVENKFIKLEAFPNPIQNANRLNLRLFSAQAEAIQLRLFDLSGKLLFQSSWECEQGANEFFLDLPESTEQLLFLNLTSSQDNELLKIRR